MTTIEIILTCYLATSTLLSIALVYALKQAMKVMKMASENSDMFYNKLVKLQGTNNNTTTAVTNVTNVNEAVAEAIKMAHTESVHQAREAAARDTVELLNRSRDL